MSIDSNGVRTSIRNLLCHIFGVALVYAIMIVSAATAFGEADEVASVPHGNTFHCNEDGDEIHCYIKLKVQNIGLDFIATGWWHLTFRIQGESGRYIEWLVESQNDYRAEQCKDMAVTASIHPSKHLQFHVWYKKDTTWQPPTIHAMKMTIIDHDQETLSKPTRVGCYLVTEEPSSPGTGDTRTGTGTGTGTGVLPFSE